MNANRNSPIRPSCRIPFPFRLRGALFLLLLCLLTGCGGTSRAGDPSQGNRQVTLTLFSFLKPEEDPLVHFIREKLPDIDLQVEYFSGDYQRELKRRLLHNTASDLILAPSLDVNPSGEDFLSRYAVDLTSSPFIGRYHLTSMRQIVQHGRIYAVPLPGQIQSIAYNKTLMQQLGLPVPKSYPQFLEVCAAAQEKGSVPFLADFSSKTGLADFVKRLAACNFLSTPAGTRWELDYLDGRASMSGTWEPILEQFGELCQRGIVTPDSLDTYPCQLVKQFSNGEVLFCPAGAQFQFDVKQTNPQIELGYLPYWGNQEEDGWLFLSPYSYLALNDRLNRPENLQKKKAALRVLDQISTPEGQRALAQNSTGRFSYLQGVSLPEEADFSQLQDALDRGRVIGVTPYPHVDPVLNQGLAAYLDGSKTLSQVLKDCDQANLSPAPWKKDLSLSVMLGYCGNTERFDAFRTLREETGLGDLIADACREAAGTDLALFFGRDIGSCFYEGVITEEDLLHVLDPQGGTHQSHDPMVLIQLTGAQIESLLQQACFDPARFQQVSGIRFYIDREQGTVTRLTLSDGSKLEADRVYTLAAERAMLDPAEEQSFLIPAEPLRELASPDDAVRQYLRKEGAVQIRKDGRIGLA